MVSNIMITRWFGVEEIGLMRRCLEAIVSNHFIEEHLVPTLTGRSVAEFRDLLARFSVVTLQECSLSEDDLDRICQAVGQLTGYPVDRPRELEVLLGIPLGHLSWFWYKLHFVRNRWAQHTEDDVNSQRGAS